MSSERRPTLAEAIRRQIGGALDDLHTCLPAVVTAYDATTQKVSVKPLVKHAYLDEDDKRQVESLGVVNGVPVQFMSAGGFTLTCPVSDGNLVIEGAVVPATRGTLIFSEASMDLWLTGSGAEVDPAIDHRFSLADGIFIPGLNPFGDPLQGVPTDHAAFGAVGGVLLHAHKTLMTVATSGEEGAADFVALAAKVLTELQRIQTALSAHTHGPGSFNVPASPGPVVGLSDPSASFTPLAVAATRLKSK